jgi:hypothetical protein
MFTIEARDLDDYSIRSSPEWINYLLPLFVEFKFLGLLSSTLTKKERLVLSAATIRNHSPDFLRDLRNL